MPNTLPNTVAERLTALETQAKQSAATLRKLDEGFEKFVEEISAWRVKAGRPNWSLLMGLSAIITGGSGILVTVLIASLSVFWFMINAQVLNVVSPLKQEMSTTTSQTKTNSDVLASTVLPDLSGLKTSAAQSQQDRKDLREQLVVLQAQVTTNSGNIRTMAESAKEVETQFHQSYETLNIHFAEQQRTNSDVRNALVSLHATMPEYPTAPFYYPGSSSKAQTPNK